MTVSVCDHPVDREESLQHCDMAVNYSKEVVVDNITEVLEDFEEFDLRDALNVGAYSLMSFGELVHYF